jgi:rSAM/selenodomain-associated transferase 1
MPGAAVVIARAPVPGACKTRLEPLLGPDGCARLHAALIARAVAWAHAAAPGAAYLGHTGAAAGVRGLVPAATRLFAQVDGDLGRRLAAAAARVHAEAGGPVLVVGADVPALGAAHAAAAFDDLAHGCDVVLGPSTDGGYYLIGLRQPRPDLFALADGAWGGPDVLRLTLAAAEGAGLGVGLLRAERDLDEPADARALLADPLTPADVRALLA